MKTLITFSLYATLCAALSAQTVSTGQYNNQRTGSNTAETILTQAKVSGPYSNLKLLGSYAVDGMVTGHPLLITGVNIGGATNALIVVTINNMQTMAGGGGSVYLFNADIPGSAYIWRTNLVTPLTNVVSGCLQTPVVDTVNGIIYAVCGDSTPNWWVNSLNLADGSTHHARTQIACSYSGMTFTPNVQLVRTALLLSGGVLYFGSAAGGGGNEDTTGAAGWEFAYNGSTLAQTGCIATAISGFGANVGPAGVWNSGWGQAVDASGNIWLTTGNGPCTGASNFGDSFISFNTSLAVQGSFTPSDCASNINPNDLDIAAGGVIAVGTHVFGGGKDGRIWVDPTGGREGSGGTFAQEFSTGLGGTGGGANIQFMFGDNTMFYTAAGKAITTFAWTGSAFNTTAVAASSLTFAKLAANLSYSSNGGKAGTGVLWATTAANALGGANSWNSPTTLRAFNPTTMVELWNSGTCGCQTPGSLPKMSMPLVANGRVYTGTASTQTVDVYGLATTIVSTPSASVGSSASGGNGGAF